MEETKTNEAGGGVGLRKRGILPDYVKPLRYDLKITPNLKSFIFDSHLVIRLEVKRTTSQVIFHSKDLSYSAVSYRLADDDGAETITCDEFHISPKKTIVAFSFPKDMTQGSIVDLTIVYTGVLNDQMAGFYRSSYQDIHGTTKIMASTQFEAVDARRAFPCIDEPAVKSVFGVTLVVPQELTCFSNMPERSRRTIKKEGGAVYSEVEFLDTPRMSTYLLAFCVGEFDFVQAESRGGTMIRVYTPPGKADRGHFALDCAVRSLDLYNEFFGTPYPLPKLDMVAIPEFAMGAMENWGLVTYREVELLIDPVMASSAQKQRVCIVVTHELAHQWFGNLVTMEWWDDLWLNEGFASWTETFATDNLFPEWNMWEQFSIGHMSSALKLDSLRSSHPIQVPIYQAQEVDEVFDAISYCKGGCVVRMIHAVLGKDLFQKGLALYMDRHKYSNTVTHQLWKCWEEVSGMPIGELMASWTEQMGFPLLKVTDEKWEADKVTITVEQSWFLSDGSEVKPEEEKQWFVPILTCTPDGTQEDVTWMREKVATVTIPLENPNGWVKLNAGQQVPFRVCLSAAMVDRLAEGIASKTLSSVDRAGVLSDTYAMVKSGEIGPEVLLKLLSSYKNETEYIVWEIIEGVLNALDTIISNNPMMSEKFRVFAKDMISGPAQIVGWNPVPSDGHLTTLLRGTMIRLLSNFCFTDEDVALEARIRFGKFLANAEDMQSLPSDVRGPVFKIILKTGGEKEYQQILSYFYSATDNAEKKHVLLTLGHTCDSRLKLRTLNWSVSGEVKIQDFFYLMGSVGRSNEGGDIAWDFFQENFNKIKKMIGKASPSLMDACIVSCCGNFCSNDKADEIENYFKINPVPLSSRRISQMIEGMRTNASLLCKLENSVCSEESFWESL
uniref:Aminopeptidase n=1 Tax=Corethron hystrix TaxID=216773 RepID=A0A7S1B8F5_9STRA|mmetsp:Transcript_16555/g.37195  ORF Transcript_16555/g.37195 Transcript_16555/m.37195 type:complete len:896 (+) Transcript_16555:162-2849(+)|eukprot:CAMPEP_0113314936 /NCGR_PEP_ID=MMETSP0010_2-20120614/10796_1 /TAXON_ID=216773 ORGANISM="Corethron hystrix, Strain 308" /NCGR_SAMPLE_ID=MMETSP0010_2 /ASSEMBLY_ACC=CAM_ASM_000155 /LENGTH=895 /DNA_ID=CAMNT_0000171319 /DNA_START=22 /DNA_END=2709 /DNA_ORIENTATION=- /assembly_acc=CAM_ASM_000155